MILKNKSKVPEFYKVPTEISTSQLLWKQCLYYIGRHPAGYLTYSKKKVNWHIFVWNHNSSAIGIF